MRAFVSSIGRWQRSASLTQWRRRSLVADSTVRIFLVGIVLALVFALSSTLFIRDHETRRLKEHVDDLLSTVQSAVSVACYTGDEAMAADIAKGLLTNRLVAGVKIQAGRVVLVDQQRTTLEGERNEVVRREIISPFNQDETVGEIVLTADTAFIRNQAANYSVMSATVLILEVFAVGWVVALVMMRTVVKPIRDFSDRTHAIRIDGHEPVEAPKGSADNEIGLLANDFNLMLSATRGLLRAEHAMREEVSASEIRFRTLVEHTPDIIVRYDRNFHVLFANPAYLRKLGLTAGQVLNKPMDAAFGWCPGNALGDYRACLQQVLATGEPDFALLEWEQPDGTMFSHEMNVVAEHDAMGHVIGVLAIGRDITERRNAEQQLQRHASYDMLTGLPNRRLFGDRLHDEIARARRNDKSVAVLFVDLDRFKEVNDTLGHETGDRLLVQAAQRLRQNVRESDMVARLGGDEFVAILPDVEDTSHLVRVAQGIVACLSEPFNLDGYMAFISGSVGIACFPNDADDQELLVSAADQAMYAAKADGRNGFSFFTQDMQLQAQTRLHISNDLHHALDLGQLQVHYQPVIHIASGEVVKAEALLRWKHPIRGMVPPDVFIPVAEENGLIHAIGDWVFRDVVDVAQRWNMQNARQQREAGQEPRARQISFNLSPRQFMKGNIDRIWLEYFSRVGANPDWVSVEITEGSLLDDRLAVLEQLDRFGAAGIQVALDDFGTGYSAMAYLKKFPIDYLKIDRSFVRDIETDPNDRAIAEAIVVMAHKLGLEVIAEGVETEGQRDILAAVGCEYVQGYLYAKPMPEEQFLKYVKEHSSGYVLLSAL